VSDDPTVRHEVTADGSTPAKEPSTPVATPPDDGAVDVRADMAPGAPSDIPVDEGAGAPLGVPDASPDASPATPPGSSARWRGPLIVLIAFAVVAVGAVALATRVPPSPAVVVPTPSPSPLPSDPEAGLLASHGEIRQRVAWAKSGIEPFTSALDQLIADADARLGQTPDPERSLDIRGTEGPFVDDSASAYGLALAYVATGDQRYADKAADFLRAWSTTTTSTEHTCPLDGDCQTSLIMGRTAPGFVFAAELIAPSGAMTAADRATFDDWLRTVILPAASQRDNNWGDAGTFMRMAVSSYLGDAGAFDAAVARWRAMMDLVPAEGYIPEEVRRGSSGITYTQEALQYKVASAVIAARRGVDLWSYTGTEGGTLKGALDYLARFADPGVRWPWHPSADFPTPSPIWEVVYGHWPDDAYRNLATAGRPYGDAGHSAIRWTTITAAPPPPGVALASPAAVLTSSPTPTASAVATASPTLLPTPSPSPSDTTGTTGDPAPLDPPTVALRTGAYRDLHHLPALVDWHKAGGDVRRYQLERFDDGRRTDRTNVSSGHTSATDHVPTGVDLGYRVRVTVRGVGTSDWADTAVHLRFIDDDDRRVAYRGTWRTAAHPDYEGGGATWSDHDGATASIDFEGRSIAWLGPIGATRGRAIVRLDGKRVGTVDLAAQDFVARRVLFVATAASAGSHTLVIEVQGSRAVAIDGFVIMAPA